MRLTGQQDTQISAMMENRGLVIANEPSLARVAALRSNCERLGAMNVAITRYDGRNFPRGLFHRVLVDAPCSAEGRERRGAGCRRDGTGWTRAFSPCRWKIIAAG